MSQATNTAPTFDVSPYVQRARQLLPNNLATMEAAASMAVETKAHYDTCVQLRTECAAVAKKIVEFWKKIKNPINAMRADILEQEKQMLAPITRLQDAFDSKAKRWIAMQRQAEQEAQSRMTAIVDQQRSELARQAKQLIAEGYVDEGLALRQQADMAVAPVIPTEDFKVQGARVGFKAKASCTDLLAFAAAVVKGEIPLMHDVKGEMRPVLVVDQVVLNAICGRIGMALNSWPGITATEEPTIGAGR